MLAGAGGGLYYITGYHRPFSLTDIAIAYPDDANIISIGVLAGVAFAAPVIIIALLGLTSHLPVFNRRGNNPRSRSQTFWEIHTGILGLCLSLAATLFLTSGIKDIIGKPRPNLLARCDADLSKITGFSVGGFGNSIDSEAEVLVTSGICRQTDHRLLDDAFAAFPSGHSSFACSGLVYLSLWLCARYGLVIPYLAHGRLDDAKTNGHPKAAPALWQLAAALAPAVVALFICCSRYADFHHAGFDIICGALLGTAVAWASFRLYHLPMRRAQALVAWGTRYDINKEQRFSMGPHDDYRAEEGFASRPAHGDRSGDTSGSGSYELRDAPPVRIGQGHPPARVSTQDSTRPIFQR